MKFDVMRQVNRRNLLRKIVMAWNGVDMNEHYKSCRYLQGDVSNLD